MKDFSTSLAPSYWAKCAHGTLVWLFGVLAMVSVALKEAFVFLFLLKKGGNTANYLACVD